MLLIIFFNYDFPEGLMGMALAGGTVLALAGVVGIGLMLTKGNK